MTLSATDLNNSYTTGTADNISILPSNEITFQSTGYYNISWSFNAYNITPSSPPITNASIYFTFVNTNTTEYPTNVFTDATPCPLDIVSGVLPENNILAATGNENVSLDAGDYKVYLWFTSNQNIESYSFTYNIAIDPNAVNYNPASYP